MAEDFNCANMIFLFYIFWILLYIIRIDVRPLCRRVTSVVGERRTDSRSILLMGASLVARGRCLRPPKPAARTTRSLEAQCVMKEKMNSLNLLLIDLLNGRVSNDYFLVNMWIKSLFEHCSVWCSWFSIKITVVKMGIRYSLAGKVTN